MQFLITRLINQFFFSFVLFSSLFRDSKFAEVQTNLVLEKSHKTILTKRLANHRCRAKMKKAIIKTRVYALHLNSEQPRAVLCYNSYIHKPRSKRYGF